MAENLECTGRGCLPSATCGLEASGCRKSFASGGIVAPKLEELQPDFPGERIISKDELDTEPGPIGILPEIPMPEPLTMELTKRAFLQQWMLGRIMASEYITNLDPKSSIKKALKAWDEIEKASK